MINSKRPFEFKCISNLGHQFVGSQNHPGLGVSVPAEVVGDEGRREAGGRRDHPVVAHDQGLPHEARPGLHLQWSNVSMWCSHAVCHPGML